jgi:hypothetical protein
MRGFFHCPRCRSHYFLGAINYQLVPGPYYETHVKIFGQNYFTGVAAANLLGKPAYQGAIV